MRAGLLLMKIVFTPLARNVLLPLGVTTATSAIDPSVQKKIYELDKTTMTVSKKIKNYIMKIVSPKQSGLF